MAFNYQQGNPFAAMGDPNDPNGLAALNGGQPPGVGQFAALGNAQPQQAPSPGLPNPAQNTGVAGPNAGAGGVAPMAQADPAAGYTADQFGQWYKGQYGADLNQDQWAQVGSAVGAPTGPNGQYSADQYTAGQKVAQGFQVQPAFFPEFQPPSYEASPAYQPPPKFQAPTMEQAMADSGYQFATKQGIGAIMAGAASRGVARTGGTMKGLIDYGQQAATQQYDKVYNRAADQYAQDYQIGRDAWGVNDATRRDARDFNYKGASDKFNAGFRARELQFADLYSRWRDNLNVNTQLALAD